MNNLSHARLTELLSYDAESGLFTRIVSRPGPKGHAGAVAGCDNGQGYIRIYVDGAPFKAHRLAWFYVHGVWPDCEIDHVNGNRADNRIANLRDVTRSQNKRNSCIYRNNRSGLKGASYSRRQRKWAAQIQVGHEKIGLGYFNSREEAHEAYCEAARRLHGEFARVA